jgi:hypothetical protein
MTCKNCDAPLTGKFCSNCGQKAEIHRITLSHVFHDFLHAFTHADKGFLLLIKKLITKPGIVAREYIEGKRKKYFNPLSFLVITSTIHALISEEIGYFAAMGESSGAGEGGGGARRMPAIWIEAFQISNDNGKLLTLILIAPLLAFLSWIFFKRSKYLFAETFVLNSFIVAESHVIRTLIFIPWFLLFPQAAGWNLAVFETSLLIYIIVAYKQFFNQHILLTILKGILTMVFFIVLYWVFILAYVYLKNLLF